MSQPTEYAPTTWQDAPSTATPLDAQHLNKLEQGVKTADQRAIAAATVAAAAQVLADAATTPDEATAIATARATAVLAAFIGAAPPAFDTWPEVVAELQRLAGADIDVLALIAAKYSKPSGGIPSSDLAPAVLADYLKSADASAAYGQKSVTDANASTIAALPTTYVQLSEVVERAQDAAAAMFRAGTNVTFTYDDAANTFTINASGGGAGSTDPEVVRDTIGGALVGGANIQITVNDPADTITIAVTGLAAVATSGSKADVGLGNVANLTPTQLAASDDFMAAYAPRVVVIDQVITAATTLNPNRHHKVDASGGAVTVTLPTPTVLGQRIRVEKVDTSTNLVQISGTIRGATSSEFLSYLSRTVEYFAESLTSWRVASSHITKAQLDAQYSGAWLTHPVTFDPVNGTAAAAIGSAGRTNYLRVMGAGTITKLAVEVTTSSGNIQLSVYRNSGLGPAAAPGTRVATTGVVVCPAAGYAEISLGAAVVVSAGDWFALGSDSGTTAFRSAITTLLTSALYSGRAYYAADHPSPPTPTGLTAGLNRPPLIIGVP